MKGCTTCKHLGHHTDEPPCAECLPAETDFPLWEASDQVNKLIEEAKKKAFEAGFHIALAMSDKDYIDVENLYNQYKEANQ